MTCSVCGPTTNAPSATVAALCAKCYGDLPARTRELYDVGRLRIRSILKPKEQR